MNLDTTAQKGGSTSFATGTICTKTGSYKSSNKYMDTIIVVVKGDKFPAGVDGSKTTWSALSSSLDGAKSGFDSVKVAAGTI
jgi:hypothetical protein